MAAAFGPGGLSPTSVSRTLEKVFEDAQYTGEIPLSQRKLREYPKVASKYDLADTASADLSRNRFAEIPLEVCEYHSMERLNCYHNVIRFIPEAIVQLQALVHLNLSRNQLSMIPPFIAQLQALEVLHASNNKLVSLPEEIGRLRRLMDLDVSCNEISHLPHQIGDLESLRHLKLCRNLLVELPVDISRLRLHKLDVAGNRISTIPLDYRKMDCIEELIIENNPLTSPPAHMCWKGRTHIMKFLRTEAQKEDRKRGILSEVELRGRNGRKMAGLQNSTSDEFKYLDSPGERRKRHTVDSGYSTTDSSDKSRWSPSEPAGDLDEASTLTRSTDPPKDLRHEGDSPGVHKPHPATTHSPALHNGPLNTPPNGQPPSRYTNHEHYAIYNHRSPSGDISNHRSPGSDLSNHRPPSVDLNNHRSPGVDLSNHRSPGGEMSNHRSPSVEASSRRSSTASGDLSSRRSSGGDLSNKSPKIDPSRDHEAGDEFTRVLQQQKSEYEAKKRNAERLRREMEDEESREREARRRAAIRVQEEQKAILTQQREDARKSISDATRPRPFRLGVDNCYSGSSPSSSPSVTSYMEQANPANRRIPQSQSFREDKIAYGNNNYRRTTSESQMGHQRDVSPAREITPEEWRNHSSASPMNDGSTHGSSSSPLPPDEEYRRRHEALISQQRQEAQRIRLCLEQEKQRLLQLQHEDNAADDQLRVRQLQKDALYSYFNKVSITVGDYQRGGQGKLSSGDEEGNYSAGRETNSSYSTALRQRAVPAPVVIHTEDPSLPVAVQKGLEEMSKDLNNMNPAFTFRRHFAQAHEELELVEQLRQNIESRLKVTLPEDLPAALKDGVVLCHLANNIRPHSVSSIHVPSPAVRKLSMAKCRRNVENFLEACRRIGVEQEHLSSPSAILEEKGTSQLAVTVQALLARVGAAAPPPSV